MEPPISMAAKEGVRAFLVVYPALLKFSGAGEMGTEDLAQAKEDREDEQGQPKSLEASGPLRPSNLTGAYATDQKSGPHAGSQSPVQKCQTGRSPKARRRAGNLGFRSWKL
jgi:hypothetical protein